MRARLAHRLIRVGGAQDPRRQRDRGAGQPARVARSRRAARGAAPRSRRAARAPRTGWSMRSVRYGCMRTRSHSPAAERSALVPDRVRDAEPAEVVDQPGAPERARLGRRQPELGAGGRGEVADRPRVPQRVRRLQVDEVGDRQQGRVEAARPRRRPRAPARPRSPRPRCATESRPPRSSSACAAEQRRERRVELLAARARCASAFGRVDAPDAVRDLDELRQLSDARRDRHTVALEPPGPTVAVPLLVAAAERLLHRVGQLELARRAVARGRAWCAIMSVNVAVAGERELEPDPEAVQRRVARRRAAASPRPRRAGSPARSRTCPTSARCRRRTTSPARSASEWQPTFTSSAV